MTAHTKEIMDHQNRSRAVIACYIGIVVSKSADDPALLTIPGKPFQAAGVGAHCKIDHGFGKTDLASSDVFSKRQQNKIALFPSPDTSR